MIGKQSVAWVDTNTEKDLTQTLKGAGPAVPLLVLTETVGGLTDVNFAR